MVEANAAYSGTDNLEIMAEARNYNAFLAALVMQHIGKKSRVMDFGAGLGTFAAALGRFGIRPVCLEPDPGQAAAIAGKGFEVFRTLEEIPACSIDAVYSLNVLEHIADERKILIELHRRLRPGGVLLVYVPAFPVLYSSMDRKVGHYRRYRLNALADLMEQAGFRVRKARYADSLGFLAALVYKWFGNECGTLDRSALIAFDRYVFPLSRQLDRVFSRFCGKNAWVVATKEQQNAGCG